MGPIADREIIILTCTVRSQYTHVLPQADLPMHMHVHAILILPHDQLVWYIAMTLLPWLYQALALELTSFLQQPDTSQVNPTVWQ